MPKRLDEELRRHDSPSEPSLSSDKAHASRKRRGTRKLMIGTLAASVSMPLLDWEVMAHGNRSSHTAAAYRSWAPDAYVLMRQELRAPNSDQTERLRQMYDALDEAERRSEPESAERDTRIIQMREDVRALENSLRVGPLTRQVLNFARAKDLDAIRTTLSATGSPDDVIDNYGSLLLDLGHHDDRGVLSTNGNAEEYEVVAQAALDFVTERLDTLQAETASPYLTVEKIKLANLLHNIASFSLPDIGEPTDAGLQIGRHAILLQLTLREELGQTTERVRALNLAGRLFGKTGETEAAGRYLDQAEAFALPIDYRAGLAYNKAYRAELVQANDPDTAALLRDEARIIAESVRGAIFEDIPYLLAFIERPR